MPWDESISLVTQLESRIDREMDTVLRKFLNPEEDPAELRGIYAGLKQAKFMVKTFIEEIEEKSR